MIFFWIRLKNASTTAFWLAALLVPMTILALGLLFTEPGNLSIQIGIYGADVGIEENLRIYGGRDWTLTGYTNREDLRQDVANRRLELGYAFEEDGIILYTSPATVTDSVTNLLVAAAYLQAATGDIGARTLRFHMDADAADIQRRAEGFLADGLLMERVVAIYKSGNDGRYGNGNGLSERLHEGLDERLNERLNERFEMIPFRRLFHGLLALFAQLLAMLCAMGFAGKNERDILRRVKAVDRKKGVLYILSGIGAVTALTGMVMLLVILPGTWLFPGIWAAQDMLPLAVYVLVVSGLATGLAMSLPEGVYPGVLVVSFIFTALMGGVIFDLREILESAQVLRFLFPSYYYITQITP